MSTPQSSSVRNALIWILPIFIMMIAVILIVLTLNGKESPDQPSATPTATEQVPDQAPEEPQEVTIDQYVAFIMENRGGDIARRDPADLAVVGEIDAPIVMVVYSDFQCKFCSLWSQQTLPALMEQYVDAGKLRIESRDIEIFGEFSRNAALAAHAAALQGKYWEMHAALLPEGQTLPKDQLTPEALAQLAGELGMDAEQFAADMASPAVAELVDRDVQEGHAIGVNSTPSFLINGVPLTGAQPLELFTTLLDAELALIG